VQVTFRDGSKEQGGVSTGSRNGINSTARVDVNSQQQYELLLAKDDAGDNVYRDSVDQHDSEDSYSDAKSVGQVNVQVQSSLTGENSSDAAVDV